MSKAKRMQIACAAVMLISICKVAACAENLEKEELRLIADVEAKLTLPPGSHKLRDYLRYYKFFGSRPNSKVEGIYLFEAGLAGVKVVKEGGLPKVLDGGCDVINVVFTRTGRIISIRCNGKA